MSEKEVKKCPKCDGIMEDGRSLSADWMIVEMEVSLKKKKTLWYGDEIIPFYCKNCGYIELYLEKK
jgi:predicted nucleic-acid-binding Zn-ribbon protein